MTNDEIVRILYRLLYDIQNGYLQNAEQTVKELIQDLDE